MKTFILVLEIYHPAELVAFVHKREEENKGRAQVSPRAAKKRHARGWSWRLNGPPPNAASSARASPPLRALSAKPRGETERLPRLFWRGDDHVSWPGREGLRQTDTCRHPERKRPAGDSSIFH
ncbi:hypothetical protein MHYP_G00217900 [Metynnis hypsauchen]